MNNHPALVPGAEFTQTSAMEPDNRKNSRDIARGTAANYGGFVFRLGVRIPFLFLAGMLYGETLYGGYIFAAAFVETVAVAALMGYKRSLFGFLEEARRAADDDKILAIIRSCWVLCMTVSLAAATLISLTSGLLADWMNSPDIATPTRVMAWAIPLIAGTDLLLATTRFKRKVRYEVLARSIAEPATLTVFALIFYLLGWKTAGLPLAYFCALAVACGVSIYGFCQCYSGIQRAGWMPFSSLASMARRSAPTAGYDVLRALLANSHIMLMAWFFSEGVVGIYGVAVQFTTLVGKIGMGFEPILAPVVAQLTTWGKPGQMARQIRQVIRWILMIQFALVLVFVLYGEVLLGLIGEQFIAGQHILSILVLAVMLQSAFACNDLPIVYRKPRLNLYLIMVLLALNTLLIFGMAPLFGPVGVALSMFFTYLANAVLGVLLVYGLFGVWTISVNFLRPLATVTIAMVAGLLLEHLEFSAWLSMPGVLVLYALLTERFALTPEDRMQIREMRRGGLSGD